MMTVYGFWNNKGGTGKTSLSFHALCAFARNNPQSRLLAVDMCPQANFSELLLGGLTGRGGEKLLQIQGGATRSTVGGYFQTRLPSPYAAPSIRTSDFIVEPYRYNSSVPKNVALVAGDPLLELQSNAISTLANNQIPGTDTWINVIAWLDDLLESLSGEYDHVFIDTNPSFSMYTQIALSSVDYLVLPVMADDSSRRAIENALSLVYGLRLPSPIYQQYAFATKLREAGLQLPQVKLIAKNRLTQYMGPASAYSTVLKSIDDVIERLVSTDPGIFAFSNVGDGVADIRDFQTTGVVAFARGLPFYEMRPGKMDVMGKRIQVNRDQLDLCAEAIDDLVTML